MAKQKHDEPTPTAPPVSVATQLRNLLTKATAEDVKELDTEIEAKETELAGLRANRKLLAQAVGLEEPKRTWSRKAKGPKPPPLRQPRLRGPRRGAGLRSRRPLSADGTATSHLAARSR
jgi:hypothetical protein